MIATFKCLYLFELLDQQRSSIWDNLRSWAAGHSIFREKNQHAKEIEHNELQAKEVIIILKLLYH